MQYGLHALVRLKLALIMALTMALTMGLGWATAAGAAHGPIELDITSAGRGSGGRVGVSSFSSTTSCPEALKSAHDDYEVSPTFTACGQFCFVHEGHTPNTADYSIRYSDSVNYLAWDTSGLEGDIGRAVYTVEYTKTARSETRGLPRPRLEVLVTDTGPKSQFPEDVWRYGRETSGTRVFARNINDLQPRTGTGPGRLNIVIPASALNPSGVTYLIFRVLGDVAAGSLPCGEWGNDDFAQWGSRLQAHRIARLRIYSPWQNLGSALLGSRGVPRLRGAGSMRGGEPITLTLTRAREGSVSFLCYGLHPLNEDFLGGKLVPDIRGRPGSMLPILVDAEGRAVIAGTWPEGLPPGFQVYLQHWIADPIGPMGYGASNAIVGTVPR